MMMLNLAAFIAVAGIIGGRTQDSGVGKRVGCYYANWSANRKDYGKFLPTNINPFLCTHIFYAFAVLDVVNDNIRAFNEDFDIKKGGYRQVTDLKIINPDLKIMLAVGGWNEGSANFSRIVADPDKRLAFVKNSAQFIRMYNFDGIDLVWQYPTFREGSSPDDKMNFGKLIQEMEQEFVNESKASGKPRLLLSLATSGLSDYIDKGYDVPTISEHVDFLNMVAYDYHSSTDPTVFHHSSLYAVKEELDDKVSAQLNADSAIRQILSKGMAPEKINLGIPTYGRLYLLEDPKKTEPGSPAVGSGRSKTIDEEGYINYYELCRDIKDKGWDVKYYNKTAMGPYAYKDNLWVSYDDEESVKMKARYAVAMGLGGIMFWTIDEDDFHGTCHGRGNPLVWAGREGLRAAQQAQPTSRAPTSRAPTTEEPRLTTKPQMVPNPRTTTSTRSPLWRKMTPDQSDSPIYGPLRRVGLPAQQPNWPTPKWPQPPFPQMPGQFPPNSIFTFIAPSSTFNQNITVWINDEKSARFGP